MARVHQICAPYGTGKGRPSALSLYRSVLLTLLLVRQNLSQTVVGDLFGISQPTVSRIFRRYLPLIEQALCLHTPPLPQALRGRVVVVDGTLIPTGNRTQPGHKRSQYRGHPNYSGKRRAQGLTVQVLAGIDGTLLTVSAGLPGSTHDSNAYQLTGLTDLLTDTPVIGDLGYQGTPVIRPRRKRPGHPTHTPENTVWNRGVSQLRWAVEHAIAHLKNWKILATGYRGRLTELPNIIRIITTLEYYRLGW